MAESADKPWFADLSPSEDKQYEDAIMRVVAAVKNRKASFDEAAAMSDIPAKLRAAVLDDALKVLIAEMHFDGPKKSTADLAGTLKLPVERIEKARAEMLKDVEAEAIEAYKASLGQGGNA